MGFFSFLKRGGEKRYTLDEILRHINADNISTSGVSVSNETALSYSPWYIGVSRISDSVACLPFPIYKTTETGRSKYRDHAVYRLLNYRANSYQSSLQLRMLLTFWALHYGNAYAEIERDAMGNAVALWPIPPDQVSMRFTQLDIDGRAYPVVVYDIKINKDSRSVLADDMIHLQGMSIDGVQGINPVKQLRDTIGVGVAIERYGNKYFANGARPDGILTFPEKLSPEDKKQVREEWQKIYGGVSNAHRIALLTSGSNYLPISNNNENSQFLETRKWSAAAVAAILRIPPHMVAFLEKSSYSSIEAQNIDFVSQTLMPWLRRWEAEVNEKLILDGEHRIGIYAEHNVDGLLRGDTSARTAYYTAGYGKYLTANEIRKLENLPAVEGGDQLMQAVNLAPAGNGADKPQDKPDKPQRAIDPALRGLLADVCGRIARREAGAVSKAVERGEPLEPVYAELRQFAGTLLSPVLPDEKLSSLLTSTLTTGGNSGEETRSAELLKAVLDAMGDTDNE